MANFSPEDLAYAAGIIDGEGHIGITEISSDYVPGDRGHRRKSPSIRAQLAVAMSCPLAPTWLRETFGGGLNIYATTGGHKPQVRWTLQGSRCAEFCGLVLPYLRTKRLQAELVINYYGDPRFVFTQRQGIPDEEIEQRREYVMAGKALNRGGQ